MNVARPSETFPQLCPGGARFADFAVADRVFYLKQPRGKLTKLGRERQRGRRIQDRFIPSYLTLPELSSTPSSNSSPNVFRRTLGLAHLGSIASRSHPRPIITALVTRNKEVRGPVGMSATVQTRWGRSPLPVAVRAACSGAPQAMP